MFDEKEDEIVFNRRRDKNAQLDLGDEGEDGMSEDSNPFSRPFGGPSAPPPPGGPFGFPSPAGGLGSPSGPFGAPQPPTPANAQGGGGNGGSGGGGGGGLVDRGVDALIAGSTAGAKGTAKGVTTWGKSFGSMGVVEWAVAGNNMLRGGALMMGLSLVLMLLSKLLGFGSVFWVFIGSTLGTAIGLAIWGFTYDRAKELAGEESEPVQTFNSASEDTAQEEENFDFGDIDFGDASFGDEDFGDADFGDAGFGEEGSGADSNSNKEEEDESFTWDFSESTEEEPTQGTAVERTQPVEVELQEIPKGTHTRRYLLDHFKGVLPYLRPKYKDWVDLMENGSPLPSKFESYLGNAADSASTSGSVDEDSKPVISTLLENDIMFQLEFQKSGKYNLDKLVSEFANLYALREVPVKGRMNPSVFATYETAGTSVMVTLFKGTANSMVSVNDVWKHEEDWLLDTENILPVVIGLDEYAEAVKQDFFEVYSALISGKSRTGKTWQVTSMCYQVSMFASPGEVQFFVADMKDKLSDFYNMGIPHIKDFASTREEIFALMRWFRDVENPRRKQILEEKGYISYKEFIEDDRDNMRELPLLIFIIDEITSIVKGASKEERDEFYGLLDTFSTQFPNSGMIWWGIPHRIIGTLHKDTYSNIHYKQIIKAQFSDIKDVMDVSKKEFPYNLVNVGESAIKYAGINNDKATFSKAVIISKSNNDNKKIAKSIRKVWSKLEHESYHGYWIDRFDKSIGEFDDYSCGCEQSKSFREELAIGQEKKEEVLEGLLTPTTPTTTQPQGTAKEKPYALEVEGDVGDSFKVDIDAIFKSANS